MIPVGKKTKKKKTDPLSILNPKEIRKYRAAFNLFLKQNAKSPSEQSITLEVLEKIMRSLFQNPTKAELKDMITEVDTDGNGEIEFQEFLQLVVSKMLDIPEEVEMKEAFRFFDKDCDGIIDPVELQRVFQRIGQELTNEECEQMIAEVDKSGTGVIHYDEFVRLMKMPPVIMDDDDEWEDEFINKQTEEDSEDDDLLT